MNVSLEAWFKKVEDVAAKTQTSRPDATTPNASSALPSRTQNIVTPQKTIEAPQESASSIPLNKVVVKGTSTVNPARWNTETADNLSQDSDKKKEKGRPLFWEDEPYSCLTCKKKSEVDFYGIGVCSWPCHETEMKRLRALRVHKSQKRETW